MSHINRCAGVYSEDDWRVILAHGAASPPFPSSAASNSVNLQHHYHSYRHSISTLDGHFGHTMDNPAYLRSISIGNGNVNSGNVTNSNNIVNVNKVIADENPEIMQWLSPLDPRRRHQDVRTDRLDGVGNWLLETNEFRLWRSNGDGEDKTVLFCCGDPGVGKTYLR